jgi:8-oxo-dGTP pyrophosphatase MutT (NUDIX family)
MGTTGIRPVDAAGLVLLRENRGTLEVLLGRRHARAGFLPDIYVFPGGRVEPEDSRGEILALLPAVAAGLARASRRPANAFLKAAFRETTEETGLRLPASAAVRVDFVCRAITPTSSHRRYNTRFLLADGAECIGDLGGDGELEDLGWRPIAETARLNLVDVTAFVLAEAVRRRHAQLPPGEEPAVRFSYVGESVRIFRGTSLGVPSTGRP